MQKVQKQKLLGILILVGMLTVILAISLPTLQMQPGEFFVPQFSEQSSPSSNQGWGNMNWFLVLIQGFQTILIILLPIYLIVGLLNRRKKHRLWLDFLKSTILILIMMWILENGKQLAQPQDGELGLQPGLFDFSILSRNVTALPEFEANPQSWMLILIMVGAAALVAGGTFLGLRYLSKRKTNADPLQELARKAQTALDDIDAAQLEFDDVIIRCYAEMSHALQAEQGIRRKQAMTTHEFEKELLAKGFPAHPVRQLTRLFEQVRYGRQQLGEDTHKQAAASLQEIIAFCEGQ